MSFQIEWPRFSVDFLEKAKTQLTAALSSSHKQEAVVDQITVTDLTMGDTPPELEILEITELLPERFKGIFKMAYSGNASIMIQTKIQANALSAPTASRSVTFKNSMLAAHYPLVVPMQMRISMLKLRGIIVLVMDQEKGVTLVFKNDPLEALLVSSTFDDVPNIQQKLQTRIEAQVRTMFQSELPQMVHNLSLIYLQKQKAASASQSTLPMYLNDNFLSKHPESVNHDARFMETDLLNSTLPSISANSEEKKWTKNRVIQQWEGNEPLLDGYTSDSDAHQVYGYTLNRSLDNLPLDTRVGLKRLPGETNSSPRRSRHPNFHPVPFEFIPLNRKSASSIGGFTHHVGLSKSQLRSTINNILTPSHRIALDFGVTAANQSNRTPRNVSSNSHTESISGSEMLNSPGLVRQGIQEDIVWRRPVQQDPARIPRRAPQITEESKGKQADVSETKNMVLDSRDNEIASHLANLMTLNQTISPAFQGRTHSVFRGQPSIIATDVNPRRRTAVKRVHTIKLGKEFRWLSHTQFASGRSANDDTKSI